MNPLLTSLLSWLSFPIYAGQGLYVRAKSLRLSPPSIGPWFGQFGKGKADCRVLVIGDSSAAAVGIESTEGAFGYQLAKKLHERNNEPIAWRISGHNSAVCGEIRDHVVPALPDEDYTHIVMMIGMNDLKNWHTVSRFKRDFGTLIYALRARYPSARIYWHQAIDMTQVPALEKPLSNILNLRGQLINRKGAQLCLERGVVCVPPLPITTPDGYCRDGFHANEDGYDAWTDHILEHWDLEVRESPAVLPFVN